MKVITASSQKGGIGKSFLQTQFAYYLAQKRGLRVMAIDLDHQGNMTGVFQRGGITPCPIPASKLLTSQVRNLPDEPFVLVGADGDELLDLESTVDKHNCYATNFRASMRALSDQFDVIVIDQNPSPDIRAIAALIASTHVYCPVQLSQESIEGLANALNSPKNGIRTIKKTFNQDMDFMGIVVNLVEPTPFQRGNLEQLIREIGDMIIRTESGFAAVKKSTAAFEAQSAGVPIWTIKKESARNSWRNIEPLFEALAKRMQLPVLTEA